MIVVPLVKYAYTRVKGFKNRIHLTSDGDTVGCIDGDSVVVTGDKIGDFEGSAIGDFKTRMIKRYHSRAH